MRIVVEVDGLYDLPDGEHEDRESTVWYLRGMQAESDEAWAADPEDGQGALRLSTPHWGMNAKILGVAEENGTVTPLPASQEQQS